MNATIIPAIEKLQSDLVSGRLAIRITEIAEDAADVIRPYWRNGVVAENKSDDSPVTVADRAAEALILKQLEAEWPGVQVVAEEQSSAQGLPPEASEWFWLIDPLDGTRGFVAGREAFTVNIALVHSSAVVAGTVVAPATHTSWRSGGEGEGAFRRQNKQAWEAIKVRARPDHAVAIISNSMSDAEAQTLIEGHGYHSWQGLDSSLKLCLIADGQFDAYPRTGPTSEWDIAAGHAVLNAAGGSIVTPNGLPLSYGKPQFRNGPFVAKGG